jgi:uncharacterized protein YkwD
MKHLRIVPLFLAIATLHAQAGHKPAQMVRTMFDETNHFRQQQGREPVKTNAKLTEAAQKHADHMARTEKMSHIGFTPYINSTGYRYSFVAENLAVFTGNLSGKDIVNGWKKSPGHRKNLREPRATEIGIAMAQGKSHRWYICQDFGHPR